MVATSFLCCHDAAFYWSGGGRVVFGLRRSHEICRLESLAGKKVFLDGTRDDDGRTRFSCQACRVVMIGRHHTRQLAEVCVRA